MNTFFPGFLNRQRLNQQMNMVGHDTRGVAFHFVAVPVMAGIQRAGACFGRKDEFVVRLPGDVIGKTRNFKMRQAAFANGDF